MNLVSRDNKEHLVSQGVREQVDLRVLVVNLVVPVRKELLETEDHQEQMVSLAALDLKEKRDRLGQLVVQGILVRMER